MGISWTPLRNLKYTSTGFTSEAPMPNRTLRDGMLHSERINSVSDRAEMLWVRMVLAADDFGLIEIGPASLKSRCLAARETVAVSDIPPLLAELHGAKLIRPYTDDRGRSVAAIEKWEQRRGAKYPKYSLPPWGTEHIVGGYVDKKARLQKPDEEKPAEKAKPAAGTDKHGRVTEKKGMRLEAFLAAVPAGDSTGWREWAEENAPAINPTEEFAKFRDHWKAQPGQRGVKVDWDATWRNWCRKAVEMGGARVYRAGGGGGSGRASLEDRNRSAVADWVPPEAKA